MYQKPRLEKFGTFRQLTLLGSDPDCDGGIYGVADGHQIACDGGGGGS